MVKLNIICEKTRLVNNKLSPLITSTSALTHIHPEGRIFGLTPRSSVINSYIYAMPA